MKTLLFLFLLLSSLDASSRTQAHMGTLINVTIGDENLSDAVFMLFKDLDNRLSTYKSDSEISQLNQKLEGFVSPVTQKVLERSLEMFRLSAGAFDITIGSLTHGAYRFGYENEHLPSHSELQKLRKFVGSERIILEGNHVKLLPGTIIDLGGIGKGYAVDLTIDMLQNTGLTKAVVAASGDIGCLGSCDIQIRDPFHPDGSIALIHSSLQRIAISTSGNYERYIKTKANNHLIDPKSGLSEQRYASITLIDAKDNTRIDALATAVAVMEEKKARQLLDSLGIGYILIYNDGQILKSNMPRGVKCNFEKAADCTVPKN
ncbi:MAG: FAD:protein FMN transferase [Sulfuricurvum sp.]|nr:FAD:protein FMN transferase [Sulfuricurvum sp.]MDD5386199.1 FAD:protein FMN transferase [Sulfuricurvum sp.]